MKLYAVHKWEFFTIYVFNSGIKKKYKNGRVLVDDPKRNWSMHYVYDEEKAAIEYLEKKHEKIITKEIERLKNLKLEIRYHHMVKDKE